jgi:hypothetical protein
MGDTQVSKKKPEELKKITADAMTAIIEGSLEVKLPTMWTDEKQRWEESERREE